MAFQGTCSKENAQICNATCVLNNTNPAFGSLSASDAYNVAKCLVKCSTMHSDPQKGMDEMNKRLQNMNIPSDIIKTSTELMTAGDWKSDVPFGSLPSASWPQALDASSSSWSHPSPTSVSAALGFSRQFPSLLDNIDMPR